MKRQPISYEPTPDLSTEKPSPAAKEPAVAKLPRPKPRLAPAPATPPTGTEMLSARVDVLVGRQFRALAKLKGIKVQALLEKALSEFLERNRF